MPATTTSRLGGTSVAADVIIVGAGFGGCYALHEVRQQGYTTKILESGQDFGGVWHFNKYPGARVDSETPLYQLGLEQVYDDFSFSERFPGSDEIRQYFAHLDKTLDLRKDTIFDSKVVNVEYDPSSNTWSLSSASGLTATCRYVIFAAGSSNKRYIPDFPKLNEFRGEVIHPAQWPEDLSLEGKKIGIIGQGASGLQIVQELAKRDCELTVFVRTPCTAIPMGQRNIPRHEAEELKSLYGSLWQKAKYASVHGYAYNDCPFSFHDLTRDERHALYERLWARGGFAFFSLLFRDYTVDKEANAEVYSFWASKVRARITDPEKRDIMAPLEQLHWICTKRPSLEMDYYEMIDRPNVKLVDLKETAIREFVANGVTTDEGKLHELDVVVFATGYDSVTGSLYDMNIHDKNGVLLQKKWKDGIKTHLGMMVPDLPNAFVLYGPQAPTSLANGPPFLELQVEWVTKVLQRMKEDDLCTLEASPAAAAAWAELSYQIFQAMLYRDTPSWYNGANIPGKRQEPLIWLGGVKAWWEACNDALEDWSTFTVMK
ncbi:hypothetical protein JDV02_004720 [Purpureocillium takamizusanense]|uniref:Uncharacterized protein n=1 Tax=Purpureocillium takamizusanense TaxID=2060973 RepID=A0A9Q8VB48_9HYPO|nr:uncharacterized protein JDV02_004720 [Purpureocillium takamizusanense]UNI18452.1 hypothetical protein JDV02_004720 [Purpureocillium takamizusanense]